MAFLLPALLAGMITPLTALSGLLGVVGAGLALARNQPAFERPGVLGTILLGWLFWLPFSVFWSLSPGTSLTYLAVLVCLPMAWIITTAHRVQIDRSMSWLLPVLLAAMIFWAVLQGPDTFTAKPQGPFNDPNLFAGFLNLLILPTLARWLAGDPTAEPPAVRVVQLALLGAGLFTSFLISSRGAILALLPMMAVLLWHARALNHAAKKRWMLLAIVLVAFAAAHFVTGGINLAQRMVSTVAEGDAPRVMLWKSALAMIADHPWLGAGLGSFQLLYAHYRASNETGSAGVWVHNDYLQLWQEAGFPAFLLLTALLFWVVRRIWLLLKSENPNSLRTLGYLAAVCGVLLHASVNFMLYFAPVTLLIGIYLALATHLVEPCKGPASFSTRRFAFPRLAVDSASRHYGAHRLLVVGYGTIVGYLLFSQVAVEYLLGDRQYAQRLSAKIHLTYPRDEIAYWLSVLSPFSPIPHQVLAFDTADAMVITGGGPEMLDEALSRMENSIRLVPCYQPFANAALAMLVKEKLDAGLIARGERIVAQSLACGPGHGLTYYYAGILDSMQPGRDPLQKWIKGLSMTRSYGEQLLLATAILVVTQPSQEKMLMPLVKEMAQDMRLRESRPGVLPEQYFWVEAQSKLKNCCGTQHLDLIEAAKRVKRASTSAMPASLAE